ncbi:hypothetical protein HBF26_17810 [Luteibacter jiangsuensis]|uniref:Uncharacterized protein n=1 Tax=Luteibacter jiangsuensis TaxID=637577 RepID=A0ABX0QBM1_9GAMM|nr:hypothetical protein [Luteibacter jiangsuensis]NID06752.1 hypothetical protein [Luteibacter jiangsuensis]
MKKPDVKLNPNPRMRYEITMRVEGAPGEFDHIDGYADYEVINPASVPLTPFSGATLEPQRHELIEFRRVSDNVYKAEVYLDRFMDEDYFGQGICRWSIVSVGAGLRHGPVTFSPGISKKEILAGSAIKRHFANASYADESMERIDIGVDDPRKYKRPEDTFTVTLESAEKFP